MIFPRIKELREYNGKTQKEISGYLSCDQSLYSKYERGEREVPVIIVIKLAKCDYILGLTNNKTRY